MSRTGNMRMQQLKRRSVSALVVKKKSVKKQKQEMSAKAKGAEQKKSELVSRETPGKDRAVSGTAGAKPGAAREKTGASVSSASASIADANVPLVIGVQRKVQKQIAKPDLTLVFDTETTGLPVNGAVDLNLQPSVIEFSGTIFEGKKEVEHVEFLINPGFLLPKGDPNNSRVPNIPKITGITDEMLKDQPKFITYLPTLKELFWGVRRAVGHNPWFDFQMLGFELKRVGAEGFPWPLTVVDTVQMSMDIKGHRMTLTQLHEHLFGEGFPAHRATPDVIACARCYFHILENRK